MNRNMKNNRMSKTNLKRQTDDKTQENSNNDKKTDDSKNKPNDNSNKRKNLNSIPNEAKQLSDEPIKNYKKSPWADQWQTIFGVSKRSSDMCPPRPDKETEEDEDEKKDKKKKEDEGVDVPYPVPKRNPWDKECGFGPVAYLFDFLDEVLKEKALAEFKKVIEAVKGIKPEKDDDPYKLQAIVFGLSNQANGKPGSSESEEDLIKVMKKLRPNFDEGAWKNGFTMPVITAAIEKFGWKRPNGEDWAQKTFDRFDFDGDGRISPRELILMSIILNKQDFMSGKCTANCYQELITSTYEPIFEFLDCDGDGLISAENMWKNFKDIKRSSNNCDIYACQMPSLLNKGYRTTACNDLILRNYEKVRGLLNHNEFYSGILLGFWDRQVDNSGVKDDNSMTGISDRWSSDYKKDIICNKVLKLVKNKSRPTLPNSQSGDINY
jgi:Ca2+-binding EF-hand superfamily protein